MSVDRTRIFCPTRPPQIVAGDAKGRYSMMSQDGHDMIRANQGHSIPVSAPACLAAVATRSP